MRSHRRACRQRVGAECTRKATEGKKMGQKVWWKNNNGTDNGILNKEKKIVAPVLGAYCTLST